MTLDPDAQSESLAESQADFVSRVHAALGRSATPATIEPGPRVDPAIVRTASAEQDLAALFAERAAEVGLQVQRVAEQDLAGRVVELLNKEDVRAVAVAIANAAAVTSAIQQAECELVDWRVENAFDAHFRADAAITDVVAAVAETGTLLCGADLEHPRAAHVVPAIHIAIVYAHQIMPDLLDLWSTHAATRALPSSLVLIAGPSKTADIEGVLVTGVHGPRAVHVFLVEPLECSG